MLLWSRAEGCSGIDGRSSASFTPSMGVNLWDISPLYVNPVNLLITLTNVLAEGKGGTVRDPLEKAAVQRYEPALLRAMHRQAYSRIPGMGVSRKGAGYW